MPILRAKPNPGGFKQKAKLPYNLRIADFTMAMQDVYDFFYDVNRSQQRKRLERLDETVRPAIMSGLISDMLSESLAKHSRSLTRNKYFNGHPDLLVKGEYENDAIKAGSLGVEIKSTRNTGGTVDAHGGRDQWFCVFVYGVDNETQPATKRRPMTITKVFLAQVKKSDFRRNKRGPLGTPTSTLNKTGMAKLRSNPIYLDD